MRKTRSQTQAENASGTATSSRKRSPVPRAAPAVPAHAQDRQIDKLPTNPSPKPQTPPVAASLTSTRQPTEVVPVLDAAKLKEYQDMIQTFRVVDLNRVLQFFSVSAAGRKQELQKRVLYILKTNFEQVSQKLREIYRSSNVTVTDYYTGRTDQYGPPDPKRMFSHMQMPTVQSSADVRSAMVSVGNVGGVGGAGGAVTGNLGVPFQHNIGASMPIHPDVRLKKLAFYDVLATLIKPSSLLPRTNQRIQELPFYFTLTPQQATEIATNRDIRNGSKVEHSIQVQLRFCLLETSCEQEDCFPSNVIVKVNNKLCPLPNPIPTNRPNVEPKRPPRPVNVTSNVKLSPTVTNTIIVQWCPDFSRGYCIAAYLVKKLTSSQLLHRMKTKGIKPADYTRGLIKEKLTEDADCEIATTMLKVSLNCPLGKMKMSIPCRASTCSHLQCFDANLYLQMNERKPTWNCPVCDKPAIYDNLVIDGYFQEVLASSLLGSEDTEIQLHKDGSWSTQNLRNETQLIDTPSKPPVEKVELISDDIELITDDVKPCTKVPPPPVITNEPTSTTSSETVDLTLSDSDDDMPLAKRKTAAATTKTAPSSSAVSTSNGQRSASAQSSHISKGALEGSSAGEQNSKSNCDISNTIRQYLKTVHIPSVIPNIPAANRLHVSEETAKDPQPEDVSLLQNTSSTSNPSNEKACVSTDNITVRYYSQTNSVETPALPLFLTNPSTQETPSAESASKNSLKRKRESKTRFDKPSVVPFAKILETTVGPGDDISNISSKTKNELRKMWAIENRLKGAESLETNTSLTTYTRESGNARQAMIRSPGTGMERRLIGRISQQQKRLLNQVSEETAKEPQHGNVSSLQNTSLTSNPGNEIACVSTAVSTPAMPLVLTNTSTRETPSAESAPKRKTESNPIRNDKPPVVPFAKFLETRAGPGNDTSDKSSRTRYEFRRIWAMENQLKGAESLETNASLTTFTKESGNHLPLTPSKKRRMRKIRQEEKKRLLTQESEETAKEPQHGVVSLLQNTSLTSIPSNEMACVSTTSTQGTPSGGNVSLLQNTTSLPSNEMTDVSTDNITPCSYSQMNSVDTPAVPLIRTNTSTQETPSAESTPKRKTESNPIRNDKPPVVPFAKFLETRVGPGNDTTKESGNDLPITPAKKRRMRKIRQEEKKRLLNQVSEETAKEPQHGVVSLLQNTSLTSKPSNEMACVSTTSTQETPSGGNVSLLQNTTSLPSNEMTDVSTDNITPRSYSQMNSVDTPAVPLILTNTIIQGTTSAESASKNSLKTKTESKPIGNDKTTVVPFAKILETTVGVGNNISDISLKTPSSTTYTKASGKARPARIRTIRRKLRRNRQEEKKRLMNQVSEETAKGPQHGGEKACVSTAVPLILTNTITQETPSAGNASKNTLKRNTESNPTRNVRPPVVPLRLKGAESLLTKASLDIHNKKYGKMGSAMKRRMRKERSDYNKYCDNLSISSSSDNRRVLVQNRDNCLPGLLSNMVFAVTENSTQMHDEQLNNNSNHYDSFPTSIHCPPISMSNFNFITVVNNNFTPSSVPSNSSQSFRPPSLRQNEVLGRYPHGVNDSNINSGSRRDRSERRSRFEDITDFEARKQHTNFSMNNNANNALHRSQGNMPSISPTNTVLDSRPHFSEDHRKSTGILLPDNFRQNHLSKERRMRARNTTLFSGSAPVNVYSPTSTYTSTNPSPTTVLSQSLSPTVPTQAANANINKNDKIREKKTSDKSLPPDVSLKSLLDTVRSNNDKNESLGVDERQIWKLKKASARLMLQRCKSWRKPPRSVLAAIEEGLI